MGAAGTTLSPPPPLSPPLSPLSGEFPFAVYRQILERAHGKPKKKARFPQGDVFPAGAEGRFPRDAEALVQDALRPEERRLGCRGKGARKDPFWTQGWFKGMNWGAMGRRELPPPLDPPLAYDRFPDNCADTQHFDRYPDSVEGEVPEEAVGEADAELFLDFDKL